MRIPLGHKLKIMKRIKELQREAGEESKVGTEVKKPAKSSLVKHSELEALPEPTGGVGVETSAQVNMSSQGGNSLMQGEFNEAQSHQYFLEALKEWRSGGGTASGADNKENRVENSVGTTSERSKKEHHVRFDDAANEIKMINIESTVSEKKGFLYGAASGGNAWNLPEMPSQEEAGTKMSPRDEAKVIGVKESCWQCYKLFLKSSAVMCDKPAKAFCSEACKEKFLAKNLQNCSMGCGTRFIKSEGFMVKGRWYCSENCVDADPDIKEDAKVEDEEEEEEDYVIDL